MDPSVPTRSPRQDLAARSLPVAVRRFLDTESASGIALLVAAVAALVWANSPWDDTYERVWHSTVTLRVGTFGIREDLRHFINDGPMALFFVVVALEIKRSWSPATSVTPASPRSRPWPRPAAWSSPPVSTSPSTPAATAPTAGASPWPPTSPSPSASWPCWGPACPRRSSCSC